MSSIYIPIRVFIFLIALFTTGCEYQPSNDQMPKSSAFRDTEELGSRKVKGQRVYVPIYSSLHTWQKNRFVNLTAILSIRNISMKKEIIVTKVSYFDTNGKLLKEYIDKPFSLAPIATREFVVHEDDTTGGTGANFIVQWESAENISTPIIEAVMMSTKGVQAFSFISRGKEID